MATLSPNERWQRVIPKTVAEHVRAVILGRMEGTNARRRFDLGRRLAEQLVTWAAEQAGPAPCTTAHQIECRVNEAPTRLPPALRPITRLHLGALVFNMIKEATELQEPVLKRVAERLSGNAVTPDQIQGVVDEELKRLPVVLQLEKRPGRSRARLSVDIWENLPFHEETKLVTFDFGGKSAGQAGPRYLVPTDLCFDLEEVEQLVAEVPKQQPRPLSGTKQPFLGGMEALVRAEDAAAHFRAQGIDPDFWSDIWVRNAIDRGEPKHARKDEQRKWCCAMFASEKIETRHVKYARDSPPTGVQRSRLGGQGVMVEGVPRYNYEQGDEPIELFMLESAVRALLSKSDVAGNADPSPNGKPGPSSPARSRLPREAKEECFRSMRRKLSDNVIEDQSSLRRAIDKHFEDETDQPKARTVQQWARDLWMEHERPQSHA